MSDIKVLEDKIDGVMIAVQKVETKLDSELKQADYRFDELDARVDNHSENIRSLLQWRDSNGSPGAEMRLRCVEDSAKEWSGEHLPNRMAMTEANVLALQKIVDSTIFDNVQGAVTETLDKREKTAIEMIKAWGPIVAAIVAAVAAVLSGVL